jgi:catechol 2,3-dioxygenase-like lactoylglutathione lyase family enzyme
MKLNHLDLNVYDVVRSAEFFSRYFGLALVGRPGTDAGERAEKRASSAIAIMSDGQGFVLVLQRADPGASYPEGFHLGFLVADVASVERVHALAVAGGADVSDVIHNARGTMIYFSAPEGYRVEVSCQRVRFE